MDRYLAAFLAERVGAVFAARVSGIQSFGLFVQLVETGASGLVPMRALPEDWWEVAEGNRALVGRKTRLRLSLGDEVEARLREANAQTGSLVFELMLGPGQAGAASKRGRTGRR